MEAVSVTITASTPSMPTRIQTAFDAAGDSSGASFEYLLRTAQRESNFDPTAQARTSSAAGLFQFIESTWLATFKEAGPQAGLGHYAQHIETNSNGRPRVADAEMRQEILDLRFDPEIATIMAGAYTAKNADYLENRLGREVNAGELYIAHFMGPNGAGRLIETAENDPDANAAQIFPKQARANKPIFFSGGSARSVAEVYEVLTAKHRDINGTFDFALNGKGRTGTGQTEPLIAWPGVASQAAAEPPAEPVPSRLVAARFLTELNPTEPKGGDIPVPTARPADMAEIVARADKTVPTGQEQTRMAVASALSSGEPIATTRPAQPASAPIPSRIATSWQAAENRVAQADEAFAALFGTDPQTAASDGINPYLVSNYAESPAASVADAAALPSRLVTDYGTAARTSTQTAPDTTPPVPETLTPQPLAAITSAPVNFPQAEESFDLDFDLDLDFTAEELAELRGRGELDALPDLVAERVGTLANSDDDGPNLSALEITPAANPSSAARVSSGQPLDLLSLYRSDGSTARSNTAAQPEIVPASEVANARIRGGPVDLTKLVNYSQPLIGTTFSVKR